MSKKKVAAALLLAAAVIGLIFILRSCESDEQARTSPKPTPTPTATPTPREQSTDLIAARIKGQLDAKSEINTRIDCPAKAVFDPESKFKCKVYNDDLPDGDVLQKIVVTIGENNAKFSWKTID